MITPDQLEFEERELAPTVSPYKSSQAVWKSLLLLIPAILSSTTGQLFLKMGMTQVGGFAFTPAAILETLPQVIFNPFIWIGFIGFFGGSVFWLGVISRAPLSLAYPILALSYFVVVIESWLFLGEQVSAQHLLGVAIIFIGVVIVGLSERPAKKRD
ncbi:MAG TPA: EamA family transporter [Anaerolineae bacterium]|nr:EamA family transporter [Anaerolineae bacterium]